MTTLGLRGRLASVALAVTAAGTAFGGMVAGLGVPAAASDVAAPAAPEASTAATSDGPEIGDAVTRDPAFLTARQLPQGSRYGAWKASRIYTGMPRTPKFCLQDALPPADTRYVSYRGAANVSGEEFVTVADSDSEAQALVAQLRSQIQNCYQTWLSTDIPQYREGHRSASWKRYGTQQIGDGMTVIGVFTVPPKGFVKTAHLYAIGREGNVVILLHLGVPGTAKNAPVAKFTATGAKAMRQVF